MPDMISNDEDWGKKLSGLINQAEARIAISKNVLKDTYKTIQALQASPASFPDLTEVAVRSFMDAVKEDQRENEHMLKKLRFEKQCWNEGNWEWALKP